MPGVEESEMQREFYIDQTARGWRCIDGRKGVAIVKRLPDGSYTLHARGELAEKQQGPQLLGASLGFVAVAERFAQLPPEQAFTVVEQAHQALRWEPQYHIDDHSIGETAHLESLSDDEFINLMLAINTGCGFAKFYYEDQADLYIAQARQRGWNIQLLSGKHGENGASKNYRDGTTFDTSHAANSVPDQKGFNQDMADAGRLLQEMEKILQVPGFATIAYDWLDETFGVVVETLTGGRVLPSDIEEIH